MRRPCSAVHTVRRGLCVCRFVFTLPCCYDELANVHVYPRTRFGLQCRYDALANVHVRSVSSYMIQLVACVLPMSLFEYSITCA